MHSQCTVMHSDAQSMCLLALVMPYSLLLLAIVPLAIVAVPIF